MSPIASLVRCRDDAHAAGEGARVVLDALAGVAGRPAALALSGGRVAPRFYAELVRQAGLRRVALRQVDYFWADERCVPPDHEDSNFRGAREALLEPLGVPAAQVHRLAGEEEAGEAARRAGEDWARWVEERGGRLDVGVLGVGEDGHVASLFPGNLQADLAAVEPFRHVIGPKPPPHRLTMGYGMLWRAERLVVLATGAGKEAVVEGSLSGALDTPLGRVLRGRSGREPATILLASGQTSLHM